MYNAAHRQVHRQGRSALIIKIPVKEPSGKWKVGISRYKYGERSTEERQRRERQGTVRDGDRCRHKELAPRPRASEFNCWPSGREYNRFRSQGPRHGDGIWIGMDTSVWIRMASCVHAVELTRC